MLATGPIMAIGAVDMLIPPSALTVLLGSLSGISISKLLIGGVVPGLILSVAFVGYIVVRVKTRPELAPATPIERKTGWARYELLVLYVLPLASIFVVVIGAMSAGLRHADRKRGARRARHHGAGGGLPRHQRR